MSSNFHFKRMIDVCQQSHGCYIPLLIPSCSLQSVREQWSCIMSIKGEWSLHGHEPLSHRNKTKSALV